MASSAHLPIDDVLPELLRTVASHPSVVLIAEPGAGKTTRVPLALLDAPWLRQEGGAQERQVLVLEPRRLATRMAAEYVASQLGERVGGTVGYQMRLDRKISPSTRLCFMTEGSLGRIIMDANAWSRVAMVVFDEFHERHLESDLMLALLRAQQREQIQRGDPHPIRLLIMSATMDGEAVASFLDNAPLLRSAGRAYPIEVNHLERPAKADALATDIAITLRRAFQAHPEGDALVFLPGMADIRKAMQASAPVGRDLEADLIALHGSLPNADQRRVLEPLWDAAGNALRRRRAIFSTNIAETSLTLPSVRIVVDSGIEQRATIHPVTQAMELKRVGISQASATQRAGRAGRTAPGHCYRIYTAHELTLRPKFAPPEVLRSDLSHAILYTAAIVGAKAALQWLTPPPPEALLRGTALMQRLGLISDHGQLLPLGRTALTMPLPPRLARLLEAGTELGCEEAALCAAAILSEGSFLPRGESPLPNDCSLAEHVDAFEQALASASMSQAARAYGFDAARLEAVDRTAQQLRRSQSNQRSQSNLPTHRGRQSERDIPRLHDDHRLNRALLRAFPDRIGRLRDPQTGSASRTREVVLANGLVATIDPATGFAEASVSQLGAWVVVPELDHRGGALWATQLARVHSDWLLEDLAEELVETRTMVWDERAQRVVEVDRIEIGGLALEEIRREPRDSAKAAELLLEMANKFGLSRLATTAVESAAIEHWFDRIAFLANEANEGASDANSEWPMRGTAQLLSALALAIKGFTRFEEIRQAGVLQLLENSLSNEQRRQLAERAPSALALPSGRSVQVNYPPGQSPWVEGRLQEFFGQQTTPLLGVRALPMVVHLLAPNGRALQVTQDLARFWQVHYAPLARELRRAYPRHPWPEDPLSALPTSRAKPRTGR